MAIADDLDTHVRQIVALHFDPCTGSPYWLERQERLRFNAAREIKTFADLAVLGAMEEDALSRRPVLDFVPMSERHRLTGAVIADTGGTTGPPKRTIFSREEFHAAFVDPFVQMAGHVGFPREAAWLFVGPSGPHVISQAAAGCAAALGSYQPFTVDFDPRWFRKLPLDSIGRKRYLQHLLDQAADVLRSESIEVLFTTPAMVQGLVTIMTDLQRQRIRGVHYGGMRVTPDVLQKAQSEWFPDAVHLAGYGNSLFGVCMESGGVVSRTLRYFPHGLRLQMQVATDGRVWMHRLDRTVLIVNLAERDIGRPASPALELAGMGFSQGVEDPGPAEELSRTVTAGIY